MLETSSFSLAWPTDLHFPTKVVATMAGCVDRNAGNTLGLVARCADGDGARQEVINPDEAKYTVSGKMVLGDLSALNGRL